MPLMPGYDKTVIPMIHQKPGYFFILSHSVLNKLSIDIIIDGQV